MCKNLIVLLVLILLFSSCLRDKRKTVAMHQPTIALMETFSSPLDSLEIPAQITDRNEIILRRTGYTISYNPETRIPNWVAWHLTAEHTDGAVSRMNQYLEDEDVPVPRATNEDYHESGWSRGHLCPAADNKWSELAMRESNLLTNICPQHASLNSGLWNQIERDCRKWANMYGNLYIVCGPLLLNREHETIGKNKIVVPEALFKVVLCLNGSPKGMGFVVKNNAGTRKKDLYYNSIDQIERITGIDFFPNLPDDVEDDVESKLDMELWR